MAERVVVVRDWDPKLGFVEREVVVNIENDEERQSRMVQEEQDRRTFDKFLGRVSSSQSDGDL